MTKLKRRKVGRPGTGKRAEPAGEFAKAGGPLLTTPTRKEIRKILAENPPPVAADIIVQMARGSKETIRILGQLVSDPDKDIKARASMAMLGLANAYAVPGILPNLIIASLDKDAEPSQGAEGAHLMGPILLLGLPILGIELTRGEAEARIAAAKAIGAAASHGYDVGLLTPALANGICDKDERVRGAVLAALGEMEAAGQEIKFLVPSLLTATHEGCPVRAKAMELVRRPGVSARLSGILGEFAAQAMENLEDHMSRIQAASFIDLIIKSEPFLEGVRRQDPGYLAARAALEGVLTEIARLEEAEGTPKS
jgi:HEAT repeat protein